MTRASQSGLAQATASLRQMDKYIPQDQRNDAIAMAGSIGRQSATADEPRLPAPVVREAPAPVRTAQLPPSTPSKPKAPEPTAKPAPAKRSEEHTSELQSLMCISYAVFCLKKKTTHKPPYNQTTQHINTTSTT